MGALTVQTRLSAGETGEFDRLLDDSIGRVKSLPYTDRNGREIDESISPTDSNVGGENDDVCIVDLSTSQLGVIACSLCLYGELDIREVSLDSLFERLC